MYHSIQFRSSWTADVEISPKHRLEQLPIRRGMRVVADTRPYVVSSANGLIEVADLFFDDGSVTRAVPFERFRFVEENKT